MAYITYTATRNIMSGHTLSTSYSLDFEASVLNKSFNIINFKNVSISGARETILHRNETIIQVTAIMLSETNITQFEEFLASVSAGETFILDMYGSIATPDNPKNCLLNSPSWANNRTGMLRSDYEINFEVKIL